MPTDRRGQRPRQPNVIRNHPAVPGGSHVPESEPHLERADCLLNPRMRFRGTVDTKLAFPVCGDAFLG
jgi:hypothetical protein